LNISCNQITSLPIELGQIFSLTALSACGNRLATLPDSLFDCWQNLEELDLSSNDLSTIPSSIGALESLTCLDLSENEALCSLPERTSALFNLSQLKLYQCGFRTVPSQIESLGMLSWLSIEANPLEPSEQQRIAHSELAKIVSYDHWTADNASASSTSTTNSLQISRY
jgi:internalin A